MTTQHTPGPWESVEWDDGAWPICIESTITPRIAYVCEAGPHTEANARVIKAAPTMLAVLQEAVRGKVINNWLTGGETVCLVCGELPPLGGHDDACWVDKAEVVIDHATGGAS